MSEHRFREGTIRKLWPMETQKFRDHLLRLDGDSRRMRFAHGVSEAFIADYASRMNDMDAIVFGHFEDGEVRAVAELRKLGAVWSPDAEAAFSVEAPYQNQGLGTELMGRVVQAARNRGVQHLYMSCLAENSKMQVIARKHHALPASTMRPSAMSKAMSSATSSPRRRALCRSSWRQWRTGSAS
jgi:GNAT superfamily N-acetyltransferase